MDADFHFLKNLEVGVLFKLDAVFHIIIILKFVVRFKLDADFNRVEARVHSKSDTELNRVT